VPCWRMSFLVTLLLVAFSSVLAQQTPKDGSQTRSDNNSSTSNPDSVPVPPSILFSSPNGISEPPNPKPTTRVEAEIIHAAASAASDAYINNSILPLIRANWYQLVSKSKEKVGGDATVEFTIQKDGSLAEISLTDGAAHAALGDLALRAVKNSDRFASLPTDITASSLSVRAHFRYEGPAALGVQRSVITPPEVLYQLDPEPSEEARRKVISGTVVVKLIVTPKGEASNVRVIKGLGNGLDEKAIEAVQTWKFKPATKDGEPVAVEIAVEFDFHIYKKEP